MKISAVMIVKNEEACLAECLESIRGVDELIICDTGSTDSTIEIAEGFGAKVFTDYQWNDDFAEARNHAKAKATGDWILSIDADEVLAPGALNVLRQEIEKATTPTLSVRMAPAGPGSEFVFPRVFRNSSEIMWKGVCHNYLSTTETAAIPVTITYGYSEAHKKDPDRALRMLHKAVDIIPNAAREVYYLAREYWYRKNYAVAEKWYHLYVSERASWGPEWADGWLMLARCQYAQGRTNEARVSCLRALAHVAGFPEALEFLAQMAGPKNAEMWRLFASVADDSNVLFRRAPAVQGSGYYDQLFSASSDMTRYQAIHERIGTWAQGKTLDICCGTGELRNYVEDYAGFDFSSKAVEIANDPRVWVGNVYNEPLEGYQTYVVTEVLEHLADDLGALQRIPGGSEIILSVPSFADPSHVRTFTEQKLKLRYYDLVDIQEIVRYNWIEGQWKAGGPVSAAYILLARGKRKLR